MTIDELVDAGFPRENWPEELPEPGEGSVTMTELEGTQRLYRYEAAVGGESYAMEVVLDTATVPDPAEGVSFMLNQFAYLWRMKKHEIVVGDGGSVRRIHF